MALLKLSSVLTLCLWPLLLLFSSISFSTEESLLNLTKANMKQIVIDFSAAGWKKSVTHFLKGVVLYAAIGAVGYATTRYTSWHPGTLIEVATYTGVGEALQAASKWLTTQTASDSQDVVAPTLG